MSAEAPSPEQEPVNEGSESASLKESDLNENSESSNESLSGAETIPDEMEASGPQGGSGLDNEARLQQLEKEHETLRSQYMRIAADFDNFRKRQTRDNDDLKLQLTCNTLTEILPVVDNFERARQQLDPQGEEAQALHRSYQGLYKQLVEVLKQLGVAPMRVVGQAFDPNLHEAVLREPSEKFAEEIIIDELQRGYHLNGRVLRHALVKVSMGPGDVPTSSDQANEKVTDSSDENDSETNDSEV